MTEPSDDLPQDVADLNDPTAPDPTPDEITDPDHPDYVSPYLPDDEVSI